MPDNPLFLQGRGQYNPERRVVAIPGLGEISYEDVKDFVGWAGGLLGGDDDGGGNNLAPAPPPIPANGGGGGGGMYAGCQIQLPVQVVSRAYCPPGYVVVQPPGQGKQCMLKAVARSCGLWKPARKPPIKASDWRCLMRADATVKKLDRVAKIANRVSGKAPLTRTRRKSSR